MRSKSGLSGWIPELFYGRFVHAGAVKIADFLIHRRSFRIVYRGLFENIAQDGAIAFRQFTAAPPAGLIRGDRIIGHPKPASILIKIDARVGRFVYVGDAESGASLRQRASGE